MDGDRRAFLTRASKALLLGAVGSLATRAGAIAQQEAAVGPASALLPAGARSLFADVNGIRMHYVAMGSGPLVVLLHGWPQTWFAWHGVMPRLAQRFTVIAPDLRGTGLSELTPSGYDKQTIAEDIRALIAHRGASKAVVVGHDMGGKAAYVLAHLRPDCIAKLALIDCLLPGTENMDALRGGAWHYGFHMASDVPEMLTRGREEVYIRALIRAWSHRKDAVSERAISEYARHYRQPGRMTAGFNYYRTLRQDAPFAATLRDNKLHMPVLAMGGQFGVGAKLAQALQGEAEDLTAVVAEGSGHFVAEEAPDFFVDTLQRFILA